MRKKLTIGINCKIFEQPNADLKTTYTYNLVKQLNTLDQKNNYILYFSKEPNETLKKDLKLSLEKSNVKTKILSKLISWNQVNLAFELVNNPIDIFLTEDKNFPMGAKSCNKFITIVNDVTSIKDRISCKFSNNLIVPSNFIAQKILNKKWHIKSANINTITPGFDNTYIKTLSNNDSKKILKKYNLDNTNYLVYQNQNSTKSDFYNIIEAFEALVNNNIKFRNWVLVVLNKPTTVKNTVTTNNIKYLTKLSNKDTLTLVELSKGAINSNTKDINFNKILEYNYLQKPVLISNEGVYKEANLSGVFLTNFENIDDIKQGINQLIEFKTKIKQLTNEFLWEKTSEQLLKVILKNV